MNTIKLEYITLSKDFSLFCEESLGDPGRDFEPGGPFVEFSGAWDIPPTCEDVATCYGAFKTPGMGGMWRFGFKDEEVNFDMKASQFCAVARGLYAAARDMADTGRDVLYLLDKDIVLYIEEESLLYIEFGELCTIIHRVGNFDFVNDDVAMIGGVSFRTKQTPLLWDDDEE